MVDFSLDGCGLFLGKVEGKGLVYNAVKFLLGNAGGKVFLVNRRFDFERRSRLN